MKVLEIVNILLKKYPLNSQEQWDNSGILNKDFTNNEVINIGVSLDINLNTIKEAINKNINLLITHHPMFLLKENETISDKLKDKYYSKLYKELIKNKITVLSLHTCFDINSNGMNNALANKLGLSNVKRKKGYYGVVGKLNNYLLSSIKKLKPDAIISNNENLNIKDALIYIGGGACSSEIESLLNTNIDVFISSEIKWHLYVKAHDLGKTLIDIGHNTEVIFVDTISKILKDNNINSIKLSSIKLKNHK